MAFKKRNVPVARSGDEVIASGENVQRSPAGVRPSFLTSQPVTSTGCPSLDSLLGGHGGLALGSSLLIGEGGTTEFAGALLKYYAAEGICHGHILHVVGVGDGWVRELPAVAEGRSSGRKEKTAVDEEKMKIAWRYEKLGQAGERALPDRSSPSSLTADASSPEVPFCHTFDLTKRLNIPTDAKINHIPIPPTASPFESILRSLTQNIKSSRPGSIHRIIIPTLLSPALYPPHSSRPENILRFLHGLRALLRQHATTTTATITLPLSLYPRTTALVRWAEILADGVLELTPFPHLMDSVADISPGAKKKDDEQPQGMLKVHKLPVNSERGEGGAGAGNSIGEDLAFTVSRRKFVIAPYALPPVEGDQEAQAGGEGEVKLTGKEAEF